MTILAPAPAATAAELQAAARALYRQSLAEGDPLTGRELGAMHGRSERWGNLRVREVRDAATPAPIEPTPPMLPNVDLAESATPDTAAIADPDHVADVSNMVTSPPAPTSWATSGDAVDAEDTAEPAPATAAPARRGIVVWPVLLLMLPATVAIWGGWVGLGELAGFGVVNLLPGIANVEVNTAITLPIGMETYSAYALYVWLSGRAPRRATGYARASALLALGIGAAGQVAYHVMDAAALPAAPVWVTAAVACIPVAVVALGGTLVHMVRRGDE